MKKILIIIIVALFTFNLVSYVGTQVIDDIPTVYAADENGDGLDDETGEPIGEEEEVEEAEANADLIESISDGARTVLLNLQSLIAVFLYVLNYLLWPVLMMIGGLMDNSLIFGGGMEDRLLSIWSQIRNIVNLAFVVILIGIAIYNVLGIGEEGNYTIKKILPKFVIALLVINFTFVGAKVVLDAANVMTNAVFSLPNVIEEEFSLTRVDQLEVAVCEAWENIAGNGVEDIFTSEERGGFQMCEPGENGSSKFTETAKNFFQRLSSNNIALVMAVNMGQIHRGIDVSEQVLRDPTITNLTINIIFSIVMYLAYASAFLALFFVLLVRVVVLWAIIALSPLVGVQIAVPELVSGMGGNTDLKDQFVKHAIAPIVIGFGMTLGYLMLDAYHRTSSAALGIQLGADFANSFSGTSDLQSLIIAAAAVVVMWTVTFAAASNTAAQGVTDGIKLFMQRQAKWAARQPLNAQLVPVPTSLQISDLNDPSVNSAADGRVSFNEILQHAGNRTSNNNNATSDNGGSQSGNTVSGQTAANAGFSNMSDVRSYADTGRTNGDRNVELIRHLRHDQRLRDNITIGELRGMLGHDATRAAAGLSVTERDRLITNLSSFEDGQHFSEIGGADARNRVFFNHWNRSVDRDARAYEREPSFEQASSDNDDDDSGGGDGN